jgi:ribosomal protein L11 methyltransferase
LKENFIQVSVSAPDSLAEAVIALLADIGFEAFEEKDGGVDAFARESAFDADTLADTLSLLGGLSYTTAVIPPKNWNAEWESNFQPVHIDGFCQIIPSFMQPAPGFQYTLFIEPKMAFGTGHHETTRLMVRQMGAIDPMGKTVLDMGCGTGILGIMAAKMGAKRCLGIDIDAWSIENSQENCRLNEVNTMELRLGDAATIPEEQFDLILANINRNVLLQDIGTYAGRLKKGGVLAISGFYLADAEALLDAGKQQHLVPVSRLEENNWCSLTFMN